MSKPNNEYPFTFGAIVIDLTHQFFGKVNPSACVIADMWADESSGDEETWVDHYRGRFKVKFEELRDKSKWYFTGAYVDTGGDVHEQCKLWEETFDAKSKSGDK